MVRMNKTKAYVLILCVAFCACGCQKQENTGNVSEKLPKQYISETEQEKESREPVTEIGESAPENKETMQKPSKKPLKKTVQLTTVVPEKTEEEESKNDPVKKPEPETVLTEDKIFALVNQMIEETKTYLQNKCVEEKMFAYILQCKLSGSLVYHVEEGKHLILFHDRIFVWENEILEKKESIPYPIYDNVNEALERAATDSGKILTKGYHQKMDGGNACYQVTAAASETGDYSISNQENTLFLHYITYDSAINIFQMGYQKEETLEQYINRFTRELSYHNVFVPKGCYKVTDNFHLTVSEKGYYGYEAKIYADDSYDAQTSEYGCLFYAAGKENQYVRDLDINGFDVRIYVNKKLDKPLLGILQGREVELLTFRNCSFYLPEAASIYGSSGMIDFFTAWKDITIEDCHLENHASTKGGGGVGFRDINKKGCSNASLKNNYIYSNCKDEVIAIFSGLDTSLMENPSQESGGGFITNVEIINNTIVGGKPLETLGPRVVGITVGYQKSPVSGVIFCGNTIEMYSANYLLIYGKTSDLRFCDNTVNIDSSYASGKHYNLFYHNEKADEGNDIKVSKNNFSILNQSGFYTLASKTGQEFEFCNNTLKCDGTVERLFDSMSVFKENTLAIETINTVYHNIQTVEGNQITANNLSVVFEGYQMKLTESILMKSDHITAKSVRGNFMMFNGDENSIQFNGKTITFDNFTLEAESVNAAYYYLCYYDKNTIQDQAVVEFKNSNLGPYIDGHKVIVNKINQDDFRVEEDGKSIQQILPVKESED